MTEHLKILLVEDSETDADLLLRFLNKQKFDFSHTRVWDRDTFLHEIIENNYDLIIADHTLPQFTGMEAFHLCKNKNKNFPFILVTGSVSEKLLTEYAKEGIDDYILKDNLLRLPSAIEKTLNKKKIEKLHEKLEGAYKDIKDSINCAKIIQDIMLPDQLILQRVFPSSFVLHKPKDVLSGDFYWFLKNENTFFIAVADSTGHGVPGAMLSMMGSNMVREAVITKKITQPSQVLDRLNKQTRRVFTTDSNTVHHGIDMAFCSINLKDHTMMYAGANRPLFITRGNELIEIKPDKKSIGEMEDRRKSFTNHHIELQSGDTLFLFSDGYTDQFHFKTGKKISTKRFKTLLTKSFSLPFKDREMIINSFFDDWKGATEQVDDMLLIGIEIP